MSEESFVSSRFYGIGKSVLTLLAQSVRLSANNREMARSLLVGRFSGLRFGPQHDSFLSSVLNERPTARALANVLGDDFAPFYEELASSARELAHFDTLAKLDESVVEAGPRPIGPTILSVDVRMVGDAEYFDTKELTTARDQYSRIAEHVDISVADEISEWDAKISEAEMNEREEPEDDSWERSPSGAAESEQETRRPSK